MAIAVFVLSLLFVSQAQAQYSWTIPCRTADQCASVMGSSSQSAQLFRCAQGYCLCANVSTGMFELCSNKDMILAATKPTGLRRNCTTNEDCNVVEGAICTVKDPKDKSNKICLCQLDKVESEDGQSCLSVVAEIGGECQEHRQCISRLEDGAECRNKACRCKSTHHFKDSKCVRNLGFGDSCNITQDGCYMTDKPMGDNLLICSDTYGCRCKKHWTYNQQRQHCEFSSASQAVVQFVTIPLLILLIAFF